MSRKNYVYDNGKTHKERVNVYQLEKRVKHWKYRTKQLSVIFNIKSA